MAKTGWTFGVDLGGTKTDIGMVDMAGKVQRRELIKTRVKDGPQAVVEDIVAAIKRLRSQDASGKVFGVGIGMAGQIDKVTGSVHFAPNLGWQEFPLQAEVSKALKMPVFVTNDVRAATWGEWLYGAGRGCDDLLCLFVGTGIGGGVVSGGRMLIGNDNAAGEVGHVTIDMRGPACTCGNRGCFEALAGGWAIARRARELVAVDAGGGRQLLELAGGKLEDITTKHVFEAYRQGLPMARKVIEELKEALVAGISGLVNAFNPARVILGGGVILNDLELIEVISKGVFAHSLKAATRNLQIVVAQLKADAGVVGAAAFAVRQAETQVER